MGTCICGHPCRDHLVRGRTTQYYGPCVEPDCGCSLATADLDGFTYDIGRDPGDDQLRLSEMR